jgi:hypothetical protein
MVATGRARSAGDLATVGLATSALHRQFLHSHFDANRH